MSSDNLEAYLRQELRSVANPAHRSQLRFHGDPDDPARPLLLFFHGLHESPDHYRWLLDPVFAAGFDVAAVRLPGHWESDLRALDRTGHDAWTAAAALFFEHFRHRALWLGGHSTGGLLAADLALRDPDPVKGLLLLAPAFAIEWPTGLTLDLGARAPWLRDALFPRPDGWRRSYKSVLAGNQVRQLSSLLNLPGRLAGRPCPPRLFVLKVALDTAVSGRAVDRFFAGYPSRTKEMMVLGPWDVYFHYSIAMRHPRNQTVARRVVTFLRTALDPAHRPIP